MFLKILLVILFKLSLFSLSLDQNGFKFHGKFCGDNIPNVNAKSIEEEVRLLSKIEAIDIIDRACKKHDLCYLVRGADNKSCDAELVSEMENMHDKLETKDCRRFSKSIIYYFKIRNDNVITVLEEGSSIRDKMTDLPLVSFRNMMNTASLSTTAGINYGITKPYGYIFDPKNNSQRKKEVLQIFPPRYKVCKVKE